MSSVLLWLLTNVPWWLWALVALAIISGVWWLDKAIGVRNLLVLAGIALVGVISAKAAQSALKAKEKADMDAANKALDRAADARQRQMEKDKNAKDPVDPRDKYLRD